MAKPNSLTTKIRQFLVMVLDPWPDAGEAWCVECKLEGKTVVIPVDGIQQHAEKHRELHGNDRMRIVGKKRVDL